MADRRLALWPAGLPPYREPAPEEGEEGGGVCARHCGCPALHEELITIPHSSQPARPSGNILCMSPPLSSHSPHFSLAKQRCERNDKQLKRSQVEHLQSSCMTCCAFQTMVAIAMHVLTTTTSCQDTPHPAAPSPLCQGTPHPAVPPTEGNYLAVILRNV